MQRKLGVVSIAMELFPRKKKTLRRGNIHAFPWILPRFSVEKLITCTSEGGHTHGLGIGLASGLIAQHVDELLNKSLNPIKEGFQLHFTTFDD